MYRAVCVNLARLLSQYCFCVVGCHTQECDEPHPEDSAWPANENCAASANNVASTNLRSNCSCDGLE